MKEPKYSLPCRIKVTEGTEIEKILSASLRTDTPIEIKGANGASVKKLILAVDKTEAYKMNFLTFYIPEEIKS